ncbi:MAG TPA: hypothetical protein VHE33_17285 [Acidobacteriaceae bacterium]|nr:hypothetical protein [Acidobacteriaceae bacterium]
MKTWQKFALILVPAILIAAIGIWRINVSRNKPVVVPKQAQETHLSDEQMVQPRKLFIDDLKSAKDLIGKPVWVQAGYEMTYYPYSGHRVDFAHKVGVLPSVQRLDVKDIVLEKVPANVETRIPRGNQQAFLVFTMPDDTKQYATAVGTIQGNDSTWYCDNVLYYDDPHQMYNLWPASLWQAIDAHQPKPGMTELETAMALGVMQQSNSSDVGNRTVYYNAGPKRWAVTFENDKATQVEPQK